MDKQEQIPFEMAGLYTDLSEEQKKRIIKVCSMMIMGQVDKTESKLRENKENIKEWIFKSELAKNVGMQRAKQEVDFADFIGSYLIGNRDMFINLPTNARAERLLEEMKNIGIIQTTEMPIKDNKEDKKVERNNDQPVGVNEQEIESKGTQAISMKQLIQDIDNQNTVAIKPAEVPIPQPLQFKETQEYQPQENLQSEAVDLSKLNNPDLLHTDKSTGKKEIKYGRYSRERRVTHNYNYQGREIQLIRVGRLYYKTSLMLGADIDEYLIQTKDRTITGLFTYGLDLSKIEEDEQYRKLFFEQLISDENIHLPNGNGYIGSIVNTGDEQNKYKIEYSEEEYTAVTELQNRLLQNRIIQANKRRTAEDKDDR